MLEWLSDIVGGGVPVARPANVRLCSTEESPVIRRQQGVACCSSALARSARAILADRDLPRLVFAAAGARLDAGEVAASRHRVVHVDSPVAAAAGARRAEAD